MEDSYRIACFDLFHKEGKTISFHGTMPTFYERRGAAPVAPEQMSSVRDAGTSIPLIVPIVPAKSKGCHVRATMR